ncbi:hypothetical protein OK016_06575 [Vibrio chagasii]|nr:hypothetical protein [Vibrio chagasii]
MVPELDPSGNSLAGTWASSCFQNGWSFDFFRRKMRDASTDFVL